MRAQRPLAKYFSSLPEYPTAVYTMEKNLKRDRASIANMEDGQMRMFT